ncbi:Uncharacterised protein [Mycobacteroides abscessus subsp. abscessus]|nr:Uncharacterised protein [Mycobacteroides abscessus subsp. abscessus]SLH39103.1 Uncharacterised protein [Mycobacteroides abscessus subsp. abscessus]
MIRALITAAIIAGIAMHFDAPAEDAVVYAVFGCLVLWYLAPVLKRLPRMVSRVLRRVRRVARWVARLFRPRKRRVVARATTTRSVSGSVPAQHITVNHNYFMLGALPAGWAGRPDVVPGQLGIPQFGEQQLRHNEIFDA